MKQRSWAEGGTGALNIKEKVQGGVVREVTPRVNSRYISDKSGA